MCGRNWKSSTSSWRLIFLSETARYAHVVPPGSLQEETSTQSTEGCPQDQ